MTTLIPLAVLALFGGALIIAAAGPIGRQLTGWLAAATMAISLVLIMSLAPEVGGGAALVHSIPWLSQWGLDLSFRLDGLGLLFAILILGIGLLVVLYAVYYLPEDDNLVRFFATLLVFAGSMLGIVLSENIVLMVVFWEITGITSFLLIAYKHNYHEGRLAARMALAVTGGGGLALLVGVLLLGRAAGSFEFSTIIANADAVRASADYPLILILVLLGVFTKSAQFPFHFWLPHAMAAPTPVSAYLHSATMVKAGVFLLGRMYPILSGTDLWFTLVAGTGAITFAYAAYLAILKDDFKGLLAYSTVSHLGLITLLFGLNTPLSAVAAVFHIINHAIFKASLFMSAGIIDHECGTRDMRRINGLWKYMPRTAVLGIVAAASMAGVPLLNGFLSKEMFFTEAVDHPAFGGMTAYLLPAFATVAGALSVAYSARFVYDVFFNGDPINLPRTPHEPPRWMRLPVEILVALVLLVGLFPALAVGVLLDAAASTVLNGELPAYKLAIWHGLNLPLAMSFVALALGLLYYWFSDAIVRLHEKYGWSITSPVAFERIYERFSGWSEAIYGFFDNGSLQRYLALLVITTLGLGYWAYAGAVPTSVIGPLGLSSVSVIPAFGFVAMLIGVAGVVLLHQHRITAVMFLSLIGTVTAVVFIRYSAPDLALTQLSVEVVSIVLLLMALRFMPQVTYDQESRTRLVRDGVLSVGAGVAVGLITLAFLTRSFETISGYFIENAKPGGGGTNVVNVILVDFRGYDTFGEITVLTLAALGVDALLRGLRLVPYAKISAPEADRHPLMLKTLVRPLLPLALVVSFYILLRGHNLPGGGFIAGLITGVALILQYLAAGMGFAETRLQVRPSLLFAIGLGLAAGTGIASFYFGAPFLTSAHDYVYPPGIGKTELASAMVFDLGVYVVVIGSVLLILTQMGQLSEREYDRRAQLEPQEEA